MATYQGNVLRTCTVIEAASYATCTDPLDMCGVNLPGSSLALLVFLFASMHDKNPYVREILILRGLSSAISHYVH